MIAMAIRGGCGFDRDLVSGFFTMLSQYKPTVETRLAASRQWRAGRPRPAAMLLQAHGWTGETRLCRNYCAVPPGLDFVPLLLPGTDVPGFPVSPLRGWSNSAAHFFAALGVATQTRDARRSTNQLRIVCRSGACAISAIRSCATRSVACRAVSPSSR